MKLILKIWLFILLAFLSNIFPQSEYDFDSDSLFVVMGNQNYKGKQDCKANVKLFSNGKAIIINVNVIDDDLVFNNNEINSDHIEIWFSVPEKSYSFAVPDIYNFDNKNFSSKFIYSDSSLYLLKKKGTLENFKNNLSDPIVIMDNDSLKNMSELDSTSFQWLIEDINDYLYNVKKSNLFIEHFFYNIVHFGFLPNKTNAILYDKKFYSPIERYLHFKLNDFASYISIKKNISNSGYSYNIIFPPQALGFVNKYGVKNLRFQVDVFDVDKTDKKLTILSTSKNRIWGNPHSFNKVSLRKNINVMLNKNIPLLGSEKKEDSKWNYPWQHIITFLPENYVLSNNGWIPIQAFKFFSNFEENDYSSYYGVTNECFLKDIVKVDLYKYTIDYKLVKEGSNKLEYINCDNHPSFDHQYLLVNEKLLLNPDNIIESFLLPSGKLAFLYSENEYFGKYGDRIHSQLFLITDSLKEIIADYDGDLFRFKIPFSNIDIMKSWGDGINKIDFVIPGEIRWINIIRHKKNDLFMLFDLGNGLKYKFEWDQKGKITKAEEVKD